jgi:hypothetical protein
MTYRGKILGFACVMYLLAMIVPDVQAQLALNVPIEDHVVLQFGDPDASLCGSTNTLPFNLRVLPTSPPSREPFVIPQGRALVITDVNFSYQDPANRLPNQHIPLFVFIGPEHADNVGTLAIAGIQLDLGSFGSANISMPSGFAVSGSGTTICGDFRGRFGTTDVSVVAILRGYLQDLKKPHFRELKKP